MEVDVTPESEEPGKGNGKTSAFADLPDTSKHLILSLPPSAPESSEMARWIASVENRLHGGNPPGGAPPPDGPPVPAHLQKTKQLIDFIKYVAVLIIALITLGWMGHSFVSQFQTAEQAAHNQAVIGGTVSTVQHGVENNERSIKNLRVRGVRIELEQQTTQDQVEQVLTLQRAAQTRGASMAARRAAQERVREIQRRIDRRRSVVQDPSELRRISEQVEQNPLLGLDGI